MASPSTAAAVAAAAAADAAGSSDNSGNKSSATAAAVAAASSSTSSLTSPGSVAFSSQHVAPVVASSHTRRPSTDASGSGSGAPSLARSDGNSSANENDNSNNGITSAGSIASKSKHTSSSRGGSSRPTASPPSPYSSGSETETSEDEHSNNSNNNKSASRPSSKPSQSKDTSNSSGDSGGTVSAPPPPPPQSTSSASAAASMSLPSISGAALLQLRSSGNPQALERISSIQPAEKRSDEAYDAPGAAASRHYRRSRSRSRERPLSSSASACRWATGNDAAVPIANEKDAMPVGRTDDRTGFSGPGDDREVRILFHGREIFPDDLIGLRVSKTFGGYGRFLGQVVKFDEPSLLYTVVYADGDAEELSIDNTLQILIQDEIERADPSLPPIAAASVPSSSSYPPPQPRPESPSDRSGPSSSMQQQQQRQPQGRSSIAPGAPGAGPPTTGGTAPGHQRPPVQISEREAQFVVSLFENHALPTLLRDGWKVRTSASGTETWFYSPPGNLPGAGRVFPSPLAVVELIASDRELLAACFPQNVHAAILSLFPDPTARVRESGGSSRKRVGPGEPDPYDLKRQRSGRDELSGAAAAAASHMRSGPPPPQQRHGGYPPGDDRDVYAPAGPGDRFSSSGSGGPSSTSVPSSARDTSRSDMRPHHHIDASEYRRVSSDTRSAPVRISSESSSGASRWAGSSSSGMRSSSVDAADYRRQYAGSPEWREHDMAPPPRRQPYASDLTQMPYHDGPPAYQSHPRPDDMPPPYYSDHTGLHTGMRAPMGGSGDAPHRYHDSRGSPSRRSPSTEHFHRHGSVRGPPPVPSSADGPRRASPPPEYRRAPMGGERSSGSRTLPPGHDPAGSSSTMAQQQAPPVPTSRGPPFSMIDVDRNVHPRSGALSPSEQQWESRRKAIDRSGYDHSSNTTSSSHHHHHRRHQQHSYNDAPSAGRVPSDRMSKSQRGSASSPGADASAMSH